jgi:hypothetical protein
VNEHEAVCEPRRHEPTSALWMTARTGDRADVVVVEFGSALLGPGDDTGRGAGVIRGGRATTTSGSSPSSVLFSSTRMPSTAALDRTRWSAVAGSEDDRIAINDGQRDLARCGPGRDRVRVDSRDVVRVASA